MPARRRVVVALALSIAAALALASMAAVVASPQTAPPSVPASSFPAQVRRNVVWYGVPVASPRSVHIESTSENASAPDDFQISYQAGNFTLVYQRVASGPITTEYTMSINGLLEWNDSSGDGNVQEGTPVAYTPLGAGAFGRYPITHAQSTAAGGVQVNSFTIVSNRGDLTLNLTIADGFVELPSGQILTPMEAKLTIRIDHNMTRSDTRLSLQMGITTSQKLSLDNQSWDDQQDFSSDDRALNVTNDAGASSSSAYFAWSNTATVNGQTGTVIPSGPSENQTMPGSGAYDLYLTYPQQAPGVTQVHIVHDPTIGVVSAAYLIGPPKGSPLPFQGDALVYVASLVAIAAVVAGTAVLVSRRRSKGP